MAARSHAGRPAAINETIEKMVEEIKQAQLVMLPKPCFYRTEMIDALGKINRDWIASLTEAGARSAISP